MKYILKYVRGEPRKCSEYHCANGIENRAEHRPAEMCTLQFPDNTWPINTF